MEIDLNETPQSDEEDESLQRTENLRTVTIAKKKSKSRKQTSPPKKETTNSLSSQFRLLYVVDPNFEKMDSSSWKFGIPYEGDQKMIPIEKVKKNRKK